MGTSIPAASYCDAVAICDQCGERIENAGLGVSLSKRRGGDGTFGEAAFLHKGNGDETYQIENQPERWDELSHFLFRLCRNVEHEF